MELTEQVLKAKISSSRSFDKKESRAKKLLLQWSELDKKLFGIMERGINTDAVTFNAKCAWAVLVMMQTGIRVGNETSAEGYVSINQHSENYGKTVQTFGLTTLQIKHCQIISPNFLVFNFTGKKQVEQNLLITDPMLVYGFKRIHDGRHSDSVLLEDVTHYELTKFVKKHVGKNFTIKDIRTARVNELFIDNLLDLDYEGVTRKADMKKLIGSAIEKTAEQIGHTKAVCKTSYISRELLTFYSDYLNEVLQNNKQTKN